jgi:hypothetical protein
MYSGRDNEWHWKLETKIDFSKLGGTVQKIEGMVMVGWCKLWDDCLQLNIHKHWIKNKKEAIAA